MLLSQLSQRKNGAQTESADCGSTGQTRTEIKPVKFIITAKIITQTELLKIIKDGNVFGHKWMVREGCTLMSMQTGCVWGGVELVFFPVTHRGPPGVDDGGGECDHCHSQDDNIVLLRCVNLFPVCEVELILCFFTAITDFFLFSFFSPCAVNLRSPMVPSSYR